MRKRLPDPDRLLCRLDPKHGPLTPFTRSSDGGRLGCKTCGTAQKPVVPGAALSDCLSRTWPRARTPEMHRLLVAFAVYVAIGLSAEALSTGIRDALQRALDGSAIDPALPCRTSLWSIPVYALSATFGFHLLERRWPRFFSLPWYLRGLGYVAFIFICEYGWGWLLESILGACPWRYVNSPVAWERYINPAFVPLWFTFGFALERLQRSVLPRLSS